MFDKRKEHLLRCDHCVAAAGERRYCDKVLGHPDAHSSKFTFEESTTYESTLTWTEMKCNAWVYIAGTVYPCEIKNENHEKHRYDFCLPNATLEWTT